MNSILPFIILILGFLLIAIELFLVPGVTFFGVAGITMLVIGVIYAFIQFSLTAAFLFLILALSLVIHKKRQGIFQQAVAQKDLYDNGWGANGKNFV